MGQEIRGSQFNTIDFVEFKRRLDQETRLLGEWLAEGGLRVGQPLAGCELEAWLVDADGRPAPRNETLLKRLGDPLVVPELASFNVELNSRPQQLGPGMFEAMQADLAQRWAAGQQAAAVDDIGLLMVGILPTVGQDDLTLAHMSRLQRYTALNEQVLRLRQGRPIRIDIDGPEPLHREHGDVMLEAAATSFQLHYMVDAPQAAHAFNLSKMLAAPMVAMAANSPYLFGHELWEETRIPLFEQAVSVGGSDYSKRVTFGIRYARESIFECFDANCHRYPVLLPMLMDEPPEQLAHLRLHNGTIWRWVRPLIGFSDDGSPHVRIEQRVLPAGPSNCDNIANAAFYFGALAELLASEPALETVLPFAQANTNFYAAARYGLTARVEWAGAEGELGTLCTEQLLPLASRGLARLGLDRPEIDHWLGILRARVEGRATGAAWQRAWVERHGRDFNGLVQAYAEQQQTGRPVHLWGL
jgi:gamma-glutamyl:cysteine ligase YbdK (ATP-grasp superfamily)